MGTKIPNYYDLGMCLDLCIHHSLHLKYPECTRQPKDFVPLDTNDDDDDDQECEAKVESERRRRITRGDPSDGRASREGRREMAEKTEGWYNASSWEKDGAPRNFTRRSKPGKIITSGAESIKSFHHGPMFCKN